MLTIKVFLNESGSLATLDKDFDLYQYQFQDKLIKLFVPTSILAPDFDLHIAGTAVKMTSVSVDSEGNEVKSSAKYLRYLKKLVVNNIEYALFERKLPSEVTYFQGQGENAPRLIFNVLHIDLVNEKIIRLITSQQVSIDVMPSTYADVEAPLDPSEYEEIEAQINEILETLEEKQDKVDLDIYYEVDHSVVGALNDLNSRLSIVEDDMEQAKEDIDALEDRVADIESIIGVGEDYIGRMEGISKPSAGTLNSFVVTKKSRQPKGGDVIFFVLKKTLEHDVNYKYIYNGSEWLELELPPIEIASNGELGIVKGSYNIPEYANNLVRADIENGVIKDIRTKNNASSDTSVKTYLNSLETATNTNAQEITKIKNGTTIVEKAKKDRNGNVIDTTYQTKEEGATKTYVKGYALPKEFNVARFLDNTRLNWKDTKDTTPQTFNVMTDHIGYTQVFNATWTNSVAEFDIANKNGFSIRLNASANRNCNARFLVTTYVRIAPTDTWKQAGTFTSGLVQFTSGDVIPIDLESNFDDLGSLIYHFVENSQIRTLVEVFMSESTSTTFTFQTNQNARFYLNTTSYTLINGVGALGQVNYFNVASYTINSANQKIILKLPNFNFEDDTHIRINIPQSIGANINHEEYKEFKVYLTRDNVEEISMRSYYNFGNSITLETLNYALIGESDEYEFDIFYTSDNQRVFFEVSKGGEGGGVDTSYVDQQDLAFVGKINTINLDASLDEETGIINATTNYAFESGKQYRLLVNLPTSQDLDDSYKMVINEDVILNCVSQRDMHITSIIGMLKECQSYDNLNGYTYNFLATYFETMEVGEERKYFFIDNIVNVISNISVNGIFPDENNNIKLEKVEFADNLIAPDDIKQEVAFGLRTSGGDASIETGKATLVKIKGNSSIPPKQEESITAELDLAGGKITNFNATTFEEGEFLFPNEVELDVSVGYPSYVSYNGDQICQNESSALLSNLGITCQGANLGTEGGKIKVNYTPKEVKKGAYIINNTRYDNLFFNTLMTNNAVARVINKMLPSTALGTYEQELVSIVGEENHINVKKQVIASNNIVYSIQSDSHVLWACCSTDLSSPSFLDLTSWGWQEDQIESFNATLDNTLITFESATYWNGTLITSEEINLISGERITTSTTFNNGDKFYFNPQFADDYSDLVTYLQGLDYELSGATETQSLHILVGVGEINSIVAVKDTSNDSYSITMGGFVYLFSNKPFAMFEGEEEQSAGWLNSIEVPNLFAWSKTNLSYTYGGLYAPTQVQGVDITFTSDYCSSKEYEVNIPTSAIGSAKFTRTNAIEVEIDKDVFKQRSIGSKVFIRNITNTEWLDGNMQPIAQPDYYGIEITGTPQAYDKITITYLQKDYGTILNTKPTSFKSSITQNWFNMQNYFTYESGRYYYCKVVKKPYRISIEGSKYLTNIGTSQVLWSASVPTTIVGLTPIDVETIETGKYEIDLSSESVSNVGYIVFKPSSNLMATSEVCIYPKWTSEEWINNSYVVNTITIPITGTNELGQQEDLPIASYGMPSIKGVYDEINLESKEYIKRIGRVSVDQLDDIKALNVPYDYDTNYVYYKLAHEIHYTISITSIYDVNDYGFEEFTTNLVNPIAYILYGQNLRDKLRTDVVTISAQSLTKAQKTQARKNIGIDLAIVKLTKAEYEALPVWESSDTGTLYLIVEN